MPKFDWSKEEAFIPHSGWPLFNVWVACGAILFGYYVIAPALLALLGK